MSEGLSGMKKNRLTLIFLLSLAALSIIFCYILFRPFLSPLLSAVVIAVVFFPVQKKMLSVVRNPSVAAFLSTSLVILIVVVPALMIGAAITNEVKHLYSFLSQRSSESGGLSPFVMNLLDRPLEWLGRYVDTSKIDLRAALLSRLQEISTFMLSEAGMIVGNITSFVLNVAITIFTLFFLFREGRTFRRRAVAILPLSKEQVTTLFEGIENTIIATVYGGLVVAGAQGFLTGVAFWALGLPSFVLWGVAASFLSLIPLVGSAIVWFPAVLFFFASGDWVRGLILLGWGAGVVGTIDNILRPYLISGRVQMHTLLIFFAVFGGVQAFGFLGLFVGPVILAVTITLLKMLRDEGRTWLLSYSGEQPQIALPLPGESEVSERVNEEII